jgi:hypothetical protein
MGDAENESAREALRRAQHKREFSLLAGAALSQSFVANVSKEIN